MAAIVSCEAEVPEDGVEPFASDVYGGSAVSAGIDWPGVRLYVLGTEPEVQERAGMMAAAWLAVAAASEERVRKSEARRERARRMADCLHCGRPTEDGAYTRVTGPDGGLHRRCDGCSGKAS
jgi:hypothetical protein